MIGETLREKKKRVSSRKQPLNIFNDETFECGPCSSILALKEKICKHNFTEGKILGFKRTAQREKVPVGEDRRASTFFSETLPSMHKQNCKNDEVTRVPLHQKSLFSNRDTSVIAHTCVHKEKTGSY